VRLQSSRERSLEVLRQCGNAFDNTWPPMSPLDIESSWRRDGKLVHRDIENNLRSTLYQCKRGTNLHGWSELPYDDENYLLVARYRRCYRVLNHCLGVLRKTLK